jgi:hypothetical protein
MLPSAFDPTGVTRMQEGQRKCWPSNVSSLTKIANYLNGTQNALAWLYLRVDGILMGASRLTDLDMPDRSRDRCSN